MPTSVGVFNIASSKVMTNVSFKTEDLYEEILCLTFWKLMKKLSEINMKNTKAHPKYESGSIYLLLREAVNYSLKFISKKIE